MIDIHSLSQQTQTQTPTLLTQSVKEKYFLYLSLTWHTTYFQNHLDLSNVPIW